MSTTLAEFIHARLDDDSKAIDAAEHAATADGATATDEPTWKLEPVWDSEWGADRYVKASIERARAQVAALRQLVTAASMPTIASIWSTHPDFDPAWRSSPE